MSPHIAALAVIMFLIGVTVGGVDNGELNINDSHNVLCILSLSFHFCHSVVTITMVSVAVAQSCKSLSHLGCFH